MTTPEETQALITTAALQVQRVKDANAALRELKAHLTTALETIGTDAIDSTTRPGVGVALAPPFVSLSVKDLPDDVVVDLARRGVLRTSRLLGGLLTADDLEALAPWASYGHRQAEIYFNAARNGTVHPTPAAAAGMAVAETARGNVAQPSLKEQAATVRHEQRQKATQQPQGPQKAACPEHPERTPKESKWGGLYCTAQIGEGVYCKWKTKKAA